MQECTTQPHMARAVTQLLLLHDVRSTGSAYAQQTLTLMPQVVHVLEGVAAHLQQAHAQDNVLHAECESMRTHCAAAASVHGAKFDSGNTGADTSTHQTLWAGAYSLDNPQCLANPELTDLLYAHI